MQAGEGPSWPVEQSGLDHTRKTDRDIFPLPHVQHTLPPLGLFSRKSRQRIGRRRHFEEEVEHTVQSLNAMYGRPDKGLRGGVHLPQQAPSRAQTRFLEFIEQANRRVGAPPDLSGPEALEELRVQEGYAELPTASPLGSFDPELVSLPAGDKQPVPLATLWGKDGQQEVEDFTRTQTLGAAEAHRRLEASGVVKCYEDPQLRDPVKYRSFIQTLHRLNLVSFQREAPVERVGIFFVKKKGGKLRLILDCRRANCWFEEPEGIHLATGDSIGRLELSEEAPLYVCSADLQNAFYTMAMPEALRPFFGLRRVTAESMGLTTLGGSPLRPGDWIYPVVSVIPMGWTHAMVWCQRINERICEEAGLTNSERLRDGSSVPSGDFWHIQYVDNLHVFGTNKAIVEERFWRAVEALRGRGLTVHEIEVNEGECQVLGWAVDRAGLFGPTLKRLWRARLAVREILRRNAASGQQLERLLGHITFISLCRREALSVLGETYTFTRKNYTRVAPLWKSVRKELSTWDGISPLIFVNLRAPWSTTLYSVDASDWGMGVTTSNITRDEASMLGKYTERWRFKDPLAKNPRRHALAAQAVGATAEGREQAETWAVFGVPELASKFQAVGFEFVDRSWKLVGRHRWLREESMPVFEARATQYAVRHSLRTVGNQQTRFVILTDSMTAAVSFDKGRSQGFRLRRVLQQTAALCLGSGLCFRSRWIPSEWNPADRPSRSGWTPSTPRLLQADDTPPTGSTGHMGQTLKEKPLLKTEEQWGLHAHGTDTTHGPVDMGHRDEHRKWRGKKEREGGKKSKSKAGGSTAHSPEQCSGAPDFAAVQQALERFCRVDRLSGERGCESPNDRQPPCRLSGDALPQRRRSEPSKLCHGCSDVQGPRHKGPTPAAEVTAGDEGLEAIVSGSESLASSIRGGLFAQSSGLKEREGGAGHCPPTGVPTLPEAIRDHNTEGARHSAPSEDQGPALPPLCRAATPHRSGDSFKDKAMGRDVDIGPPTSTVCGPDIVQDPEPGKPTKGRPGFQCHSGGDQRLHGSAMEGTAAHQPRPSSPLPFEARGGEFRGGWQAPRHGGNPSQGPLADSKVGQELRKGRPVAATFRRPPKGSSEALHRGFPRHGQKFPQPALSNRVVLHFAVFLEIFSGCGRLGKSIHRVCGWPVLFWDISYGPEYDLTSRLNQQKILHWLQTGQVRAGHLGTPCNFSRARDQPGGPPPLRSDKYPMGLSGLKPHDALKVKLGNALLFFSCRVLLMALHYGIAMTLENPRRSRLWITSSVQRLMRRRAACIAHVDFCMFGTPWKKPTTIMGIHINLDLLQPYRCIGTKWACCLLSGKPHVPLTGHAPNGCWYTKLAEPYPLRFTRLLAQAFLNTDLASIARDFSRYLS